MQPNCISRLHDSYHRNSLLQTIYNRLLKEIENSGVNPQQLWQLWHGDSHVIADDKRRWKSECPTFHMIVDKIADYFNMDVKATRLNWYER